MIVSASRRTDIPCFYVDWFFNRIAQGYACARNPMNPRQVSWISLKREAVDAFVFWSKDPEPMLDRLPALADMGYSYYFQFTLTPYDRTVEKGMRDKAAIEETFLKLSSMIGAKRVLWRYDPVLFKEGIDAEYHAREFERMCQRLRGATKPVTISFLDRYAKLGRQPILRPDEGEQRRLARFFAKTASDCGMEAVACCEALDFAQEGIGKARCIDGELIERLQGKPMGFEKDPSQREGCGCAGSVDIGAYNSCANGCIYCYANWSRESVAKNCQRHDSTSPLLIGHLEKEDRIFERKDRKDRKAHGVQTKLPI